MKLLAQSPVPIPIGGGTGISGEGLGPFGKSNLFGAGPAGGEAALRSITGGVSAIIGFMTVAGGIWFMFQMLFGGYEWINSGGDAKKLNTARERITHGFIGFTVIVGTWALLAVVGKFLGIDILLSAPQTIINQIQLK